MSDIGHPVRDLTALKLFTNTEQPRKKTHLLWILKSKSAYNNILKKIDQAKNIFMIASHWKPKINLRADNKNGNKTNKIKQCEANTVV